MLTKPTSNKVVLSQQLQITCIRTFLLFAIVFAVKANAGCLKEDVSYYLEKGFNHEQIVKLCQNSPNPAPTVAPVVQHKPNQQYSTQPNSYNPQTATVTNNQSHFGLYGNPDAVYLATAIEGYDVEVTEKDIIFSRKDCFNYGFEDLNGFRSRACPDVRYSIARRGLKIVERDDGLFGFGSTALYVSGNVKADILDLNIFKPEDQGKIRAIVESRTNKLKIKVRSGMPQSKVEAILLKLAG